MSASVASAAVFLLVGCGGSVPVVTPSPGGSATATPAPTLTAEPTSTPAAEFQPGALDTDFGDGGLVMTDMGGGSDDGGRAVAVQGDGKTVVAGEARADENHLVTFALVRYLPGGRLDPGFGVGGKVFTPFDEFNGSGALAVVVQTDGKIVAAGHAANPEAHHDTFALARYNEDGTLDDTFGNGGLVLTAIYGQAGAGPEDRANALAIDSQGRIVVAGESGSFFYDMAVARYNADGTLDDTFGDGGKLVKDLGGDDRAYSVAIQPDGKILIGGTAWQTDAEGNTSAGEFTVVRLLDDGTPDSGFGADGAVLTDFRGGDDVARSVLLRPDGRIAVAGTIQLSGGCSPNTCERYGFGMAQYTADGKLDNSFGEDGKIDPDFLVSSGAYGAVLLSDGVVGLVGHIGNEDFGLAFVDPSGAPINFSDGSEAIRIDFLGGSDRAFGAALGPNNSVVLAGDASTTDGAFDFGVARYVAPSAP